MRYLRGAVLGLAILVIPTLQAADKPAEEGFTVLFNGKDLTGWQGDTKGYKIEEGAIVCRGGRNLFTEKEYADFVLRFEFKLPPGGNNGIGIRAPLANDVSTSGMELQVLDDTAKKYEKLKPYQAHGSIYGIVPAKKGSLKPVGEWNEQEVIAQGNKIKVILNGTVIVDADLTPLIEGKEKAPDGRPHPGVKRKSGYIGLLGHGDPVAFRNLRVKEIK